MIGTYCAWLPGDHRGFRSKNHKIHSSGDYKNPPPTYEHDGLRRYHRERHPEPVEIPYEARRLVAGAIAKVLVDLGYRVLVVSVSERHAHFLADLPVDLKKFTRIVGLCKSQSSRAIKHVRPGRVWARDDTHILVKDRRQRKNCYLYLRDKQGPGAVAWSIRIEFND
jgi:hypothetical protein